MKKCKPGRFIGLILLLAALLSAILAVRGYITELKAGRGYAAIQEEAAAVSEAAAGQGAVSEAEPSGPLSPEALDETGQLEGLMEPLKEDGEDRPGRSDQDKKNDKADKGEEADKAGRIGEGERAVSKLPPNPIDFAAVSDACPDCYAWITIPDTNINYPIVQHPSDNTYYLRHDAFGNSAYYGAIFTEDYNQRDFSDPNTVIYGHNMRNGSMFQNIHYFEDMAFLEAHPTFEVYLPDRILVYRIFAAYHTDDMHLLSAYDFKDPEVFRLYLDSVLGQRSMSAIIDRTVNVTYEERIVTLSTCNGIADQRFLVQAVLTSEMKTA